MMPLPSFYEASKVRDIYVERVGLVANAADDYVKKNKIAESAVMGTHVVALCGEVFPVTKSAKPGSPVCADCKRIYESLKT